MKKIAVFGSAFNPPSLGHKSVIESLSHFDQVLLLPSVAHAWGKQMLDYETRCEMVDLFIQDLNMSNVVRSKVEETLYQPGENVTTYAVLSELQSNRPQDDFTFVIGPDNFFKFAAFYNAELILSRWSVMACPEKVKVRSTMIRDKLTNGESISDLTTPLVNAFLQKHGAWE